MSQCHDYAIFRTSWLYSTDNPSFYTTMMRLSQQRDSLNVVDDQIGCPTWVNDLAEVILLFSDKYQNKKTQEIYHFSNEGHASWYEFAKAIFEINNIKMDLSPISTEGYPTPAKRPAYSVMSKEKISQALDYKAPHWKDSLKKAVKASTC